MHIASQIQVTFEVKIITEIQTIHLSCCFENVSLLIVNGTKSVWANIPSKLFLLTGAPDQGKVASFGQADHDTILWKALKGEHSLKYANAPGLSKTHLFLG